MTDLFDRHRVIDVDTHLTEPPDVWTARMPTALHDRVPHIERRDGRTELTFEHAGLVPEFECFDQCSSAWGFFVNSSLKRLITTGEGPTTPPWG